MDYNYYDAANREMKLSTKKKKRKCKTMDYDNLSATVLPGDLFLTWEFSLCFQFSHFVSSNS